MAKIPRNSRVFVLLFAVLIFWTTIWDWGLSLESGLERMAEIAPGWAFTFPVHAYSFVSLNPSLDGDDFTIFFFRLYCNPLTYRKYFHWDQILISLWDPQVSSILRGKHMPPEDIGSSFYPKHSSYSWRGPSVREVSMKQIAAGNSEIHYGRKSFCGLSEGLFYGFNWRLNIFSTGQLPTWRSTEMSVILLLKAVYSSIFQLCSMVWQINENRFLSQTWMILFQYYCVILDGVLY